MNLLLYDFAVERSLTSDVMTSGLSATALDLCKGNLFPSDEVCPLCYHRGFGGSGRQFESRRVVLRYLYAVYTPDKVVVLT